MTDLGMATLTTGPDPGPYRTRFSKRAQREGRCGTGRSMTLIERTCSIFGGLLPAVLGK